MSTRWNIGCAGFHMKVEEYVERFGAVEVQETFFDPPGLRALGRWRRKAPAGFSFALRAWQLITHPADTPGYRLVRRPLPPQEAGGYGFFRPGEPVLRAWEAVREAAEALQARAIVFRTPASFTPTRENLRNMDRFFSCLDRRGGWHLVWDPEGVWNEREVAARCADLGLVPAQDPLLSAIEPGPAFYFRMKTKVRGRGVYGPDDFHRILETAGETDGEDRREGFVIWDTTPRPDRDAGRFQGWLRRALTEPAG